MTLRQPLPADFEPAIKPGLGVSVLFKPTQARYVFEVINGSLAPDCHVDRRSIDLGDYDDAAVERHARKMALAFLSPWAGRL